MGIRKSWIGIKSEDQEEGLPLCRNHKIPLFFIVRLQTAESKESSTIVVGNFTIGHGGIAKFGIVKQAQAQISPSQSSRAEI